MRSFAPDGFLTPHGFLPPHSSLPLPSKHLAQYIQRFEFGHAVEVKAVISVDVAQEAGALFTVEVEDMHCFVAHAQEHGDELRLRVGNVIDVRGALCYESPCTKVKEFIALGVVHIRRNSSEEHEAHEKDEVEVGKLRRTRVQPVEGLLYIII